MAGSAQLYSAKTWRRALKPEQDSKIRFVLRRTGGITSGGAADDASRIWEKRSNRTHHRIFNPGSDYISKEPYSERFGICQLDREDEDGVLASLMIA